MSEIDLLTDRLFLTALEFSGDQGKHSTDTFPPSA